MPFWRQSLPEEPCLLVQDVPRQLKRDGSLLLEYDVEEGQRMSQNRSLRDFEGGLGLHRDGIRQPFLAIGTGLAVLNQRSCLSSL